MENEARKLFLSKESLINVCELVSNQINRTLSDGDVKKIVQIIERYDFKKFKDRRESDTSVKSRLIAHISSQLEPGIVDKLDMHEYQKRIIGGVDTSTDIASTRRDVFNPERNGPIPSFMYKPLVSGLPTVPQGFSYPYYQSRDVGKSSEELYDKTMALVSDKRTNQQKGTVSGAVESSSSLAHSKEQANKYVILLLDSKNRDRSKTDLLSWIFTNTSDTKEGTTASTSENINRIISFGVTEVRIPYTSSADTPNKIITMKVKEFDSMSVIGTEQKRFHLQFRPEIDGKQILLKNYREYDNMYKFPKPITQLSNISVSFGTPLSTITFASDFFTVSIIPVSSSESYVLFDTSPSISSGEILYFNHFSTSNETKDSSVISIINAITPGWVATVIDPVTISIAVDLTTATLPFSKTECFIGSRRIFINMRLEYLP